VYPESCLEIHLEDATQAGLKDGDPIKVVSPRGEVETLCRISDALPKGVAYLATTFFPVFINNLLVSSHHPESHTLEYKGIVGRVEKR
jgi:predicted molibdopterin-dependent oxidoreductase YjgC